MLCGLSVTDEAYPKYPPQPVVRCAGYQPVGETRDAKRPTSELERP